MNKIETQSEQVERASEPAVELSAEEREVLARIEKQTRSNRPSRLRRFLKNPPTFFWWYFWQ